MKVLNIVIFTIFVRTTVFISRCCTWVAREIRFIRRMEGLETGLETLLRHQIFCGEGVHNSKV